MKQLLKRRWPWALCLTLSLCACGGGGSGSTSGGTSAGVSTAVDSTDLLSTAITGERPAPPPAPPVEFRSIDGSGNNVSNPSWGAAGTPLRRELPSAYADGVSQPSGVTRPGVREVSNAVVAQDGELEDPEGRTAFVWAWGQFLDHDIDLTPEGDEEFDIAIPVGDPHFDPFGTGSVVLPFHRSTFVDQSSPRIQPNVITSFIDGSQVYGSDQERADALRTFEGGRLKTSEGDLPPFNTLGFDNAATGDPTTFFLCGDIRANENIVLTSLHTLFIREHNRMATEIALRNPEFDDEQIYQRARRHVGALLQVITYQEFLPALLGRPLPPYAGYRPELDPAISVVFSTAAYRLGHSQVGSTLLRLGPDGQPIAEGNLTIAEAFFNPSLLVNEGGLDPVFQGLAVTLQQPTDVTIVDDLRNFLFGPPGAGGLDLASLNLQRGRDHGLDSYNAVRQHFGRPAAESFRDLSEDVEVQNRLASIYPTVNEIDAWVGLLAEDHMRDSAVGPTLFVAIASQFTRLRDGDRFFYLRDPQLAQLESTTLADVIRRNTGVTDLPSNVFQPQQRPQMPGGGGRNNNGPRKILPPRF